MKCMIQLIFFALMVMGAATPVLATNDIYDRQMAMDLAWELARPDLEIQQDGSGDQHYQNLLTVLLTGVELEEEFLADLVAEWNKRYADDYNAAIRWCDMMQGSAQDRWVRDFWGTQKTMLLEGRVVYQEGVPGVPIHLVKTWAYYRHYYCDPRYIDDRWAGGPRPLRPYSNW